MLESKTFDRVGFLIFSGLLFFGGMQYQRYSTNSDLLDQEKKQQEIEVERNKAADAVASRVLTGLSTWKKNTETIYKEMHYEKTNPIFYNICATDNYVSMFNDRQQQAIDALTYKP